MENNGKADKQHSEVTSSIMEINMWRKTTVAGKFEEIDSF